jgi:SAM-dependent methyltransferase
MVMSNLLYSTEQALIKLMKTEDGKKLAYLCYYDLDILNACLRFLNSEEWEAISKIIFNQHLSSNKALDLGAGNGIGSYALAKSGFLVTSVEPDPSTLTGYGAIKDLKNKINLLVDIVPSVGENLPFVNSSFSLVYTRQVLHHANNLLDMLKEINRVLNHGGLIIASREHVIDRHDDLNDFLLCHPLHKFTGVENAYTLKQYLDDFRSSGFKVIKVIKPWDSVINHYPISNCNLLNKIKIDSREKFGYYGELLARSSLYQRVVKKYYSYTDKTPGRMFTFIAISES